MFVKPAANPAFDEKAQESKANPRSLLVYDPALQDYLPACGRDVGSADDLYWHRRLQYLEVTMLSAAEGNASLEAEAARQQAERKRLQAEADKVAQEEAKLKQPAADAGSKKGN